MNGARSDDGYTLVEILVAMMLLSLAAAAFYQVLFSGLRGTQTARSVSSIAQEARLGLNRMVRDTREAQVIEGATDKTFRIKIDFNGDGTYQSPNSAGDHEIEIYTFDQAQQVITLGVPGGTPETLATGVAQIPGKNAFSYSSNQLAYDWDADGITSWQELDAAPSHGVSVEVGNGNGQLDYPELSYVSNVGFALRLADRSRSTDFYAEAQLRNRR
ncbi:MAG: PilW family protein [Actinomycetota bacterium]